eukprot:SAG25_NODE_4584_length_787_cov_1.281977_1_plen_40_part_10
MYSGLPTNTAYMSFCTQGHEECPHVAIARPDSVQHLHGLD